VASATIRAAPEGPPPPGYYRVKPGDTLYRIALENGQNYHDIASWNNLLSAFIMLRTPDMQTLPVLMYLLQGETRTPWGMLMAAGLLATLPLVIAFVMFQRQFISGMTAVAIKQ